MGQAGSSPPQARGLCQSLPRLRGTQHSPSQAHEGHAVLQEGPHAAGDGGALPWLGLWHLGQGMALRRVVIRGGG